MAENDFLCSSFSRLTGEALPGTAPQGQVWMLLEYNGMWGPKAFEDSSLPQSVKDHLATISGAYQGSKILLIRHPGRQPAFASPTILAKQASRSLVFYVVLSRETEPVLYSFVLQRYEDLLDLDLHGILSGARKPRQPSQEKVFLVCTHGRRDRCCARYGTVIYEELVYRYPEPARDFSLWQASHVGGHRFAPNLVCFPHGLFYGRIESGEGAALVDAYLDSRIYLDKARGRVCYPPVAQAAELYLRHATGRLDLPGFQLEEAGPVSGEAGLWRLSFKSLKDQAYHHLLIRRRETDVQVYTSCSSDEKESSIQYELVEHSFKTTIGGI